MTISYTAKVASSKKFGCFWKLLFLWKGSIYKLLWPNLITYFMLYSMLSVCYRFLLSEENRITFEKLSLHCQKYAELIPVSFVLGFYVTVVVTRWWDQYTSIPWPDSLAVYISSFINGMDDYSRLMRRTMMRYTNLTLVMVFTMISTPAKKRFPTIDHLQEAGFLLSNEKKIFEKMESRTKHPLYWLPLIWTTALINDARRDDLIKDDFGQKTLMDEVQAFRRGCGKLLNYDWISIPLVYTQVVTLAVYTYFLATLMGNQYLDPKKGYPNHTIDLIVPIFTLLQFFFYMGWLLVAETLVNPFGEDDDDFEVNWLIDRNLQISYLIVDEVHKDHPDLSRDPYWEEVVPDKLPYTEAAKFSHTEPFQGSTRHVDVPLSQRNFIMLSMITQSDDMSLETVIHEGDRRETAPLPILLRAKGVKTPSEVQKRSPSAGNSVFKLLKANMYGMKKGKDSRSTVIGTSEPAFKNNSSRLSAGSQQSSLDSLTNRRNDYTEDIFRMSDISIRKSSIRGIHNRSQYFSRFNSAVHSQISSDCRPETTRSGLMNGASQLSASLERRCEARSNDLKGQGDLCANDMDGRDANAQSYSSERQEDINTPQSMLPNEHLHIHRHERRLDVEVVPLDEMILLYDNPLPATDIQPVGRRKSLKTMEPSSTNKSIGTDASSQTEDDCCSKCEEKTATPKGESIFRPVPSRAIDIPGCSEGVEHRTIPVINADAKRTDSESDVLVLEEVLLSKDPLAHPPVEINSSGQKDRSAHQICRRDSPTTTAHPDTKTPGLQIEEHPNVTDKVPTDEEAG